MLIPKIYPISSSTQKTRQLIKSIRLLKSNQLDFFQYRRKNLNPLEVEEELNLVQEACQEEEIRFIVNSFHARQIPKNFSGIHLTSDDLNSNEKRPVGKDKVLGASCHNQKDILKAESLQVDYIFLSPIRHTNSHQYSKGIGWEQFKRVVDRTHLPVLALGGLEKKDLSKAEECGAYGVAGISKFWSG